MSAHQTHDYHLVDPSPWPLLSAFSAFAMFLGGAMLMNKYTAAPYVFGGGVVAVLSCMFGWWKSTIQEGKDHHHTKVVQTGLRMGMLLFIVSEIMFFFAFFWSFFKAFLAPEALLDADGLWPAAAGVWPPAGIETLDAWDIPLLNTMILLLSGTTVTWAHHALLEKNRRDLILGLTLTVLLGMCFTSLQALEYHHATFAFTGGIYSSNFYMATGFHGAHVLIGTVFLAVCLFRAIKGHFSPEHHLGFEFAAWYWHFVDVVWLFLFVCVYWLGGK